MLSFGWHAPSNRSTRVSHQYYILPSFKLRYMFCYLSDFPLYIFHRTPRPREHIDLTEENIRPGKGCFEHLLGRGHFCTSFRDGPAPDSKLLRENRNTGNSVTRSISKRDTGYYTALAFLTSKRSPENPTVKNGQLRSGQRNTHHSSLSGNNKRSSIRSKISRTCRRIKRPSASCPSALLANFAVSTSSRPSPT